MGHKYKKHHKAEKKNISENDKKILYLLIEFSNQLCYNTNV